MDGQVDKIKVKWHHDFAFEVKVSLGLESTSPDGVGHVSRTPRLATNKTKSAHFLSATVKAVSQCHPNLISRV